MDFLGLLVEADVTDDLPGDEVVSVGGDAAVVVEAFWGEDEGVAVPVNIDDCTQSAEYE